MYKFVGRLRPDGRPAEWITRIPARDLSDAEWENLSDAQREEAAGMYEFESGDPPVAEPVKAIVADRSAEDGEEDAGEWRT